MPELWAGIDAGKVHHHCVVINAQGKRLLSRRVANDEAGLLELIADAISLAEAATVTWAVDLNSGGAALLLALLADRGQQLLYIPGRTVFHAAASYRGDGKTDAKDAAIIADQARMRRDLQPLRLGDQISADLRVLTARRTDVTCDRTRVINRLRAQLLEYFPALERAFDYPALERAFDYSASKGALVLLTGYQAPDALRRIGAGRLQTWLRNRNVRNSADVAAAALQAANAQQLILPAQQLGARIVAKLADQVLTLDRDIAELDALIESRFREHRHAELILSMPDFGPVLGAEFIAVTGGDMTLFGSPDRLAGVAGLAPAPRDSGRISGNLHRPRRYDRRLLRAFYLSALTSIRWCPASRTYYDRKRAEGKRHVQAVITLARRRLNVLWAMLRDNNRYQATPAPSEG